MVTKTDRAERKRLLMKKRLKEKGASPSSLAKDMAGKTGISRKKVYDEILRMKNKND